MKRAVLSGVTVMIVSGLYTSALAGTLGPKKPSELVAAFANLETCTNLNNSAVWWLVDTRILSDGTSAAFEIPEKRVFVVTDVTARVQVPGATDIDLYLGYDTSPSWIVNLAGRTVGSAGTPTISTTASPNIVVKSGVPLCCGVVAHTPGAQIAGCDVRGYFAKDR